ncbi:hypothetical protein [Liquorilactobacillus mali]|uniref:Deoxynucleoside monophosphate kinase n=1 Tax=Liquorilactobacillus mali KCTC 3596 = DSM 20444 TaxID=1046596 RepID=A0A0R2E333_9LACO|nr:hypothetical protein [Liquorilactobacillus mali]KRN10777.1 hypothetical protein FD00_GL002019 [Liquorilactobacillus mali KCTC 3596 = DSM 20444]
MNGAIIMASFAGSGKDTVADMLVKDYNSIFKQKADKLSLGKEIHNIANKFFCFNSSNITMRKAMQEIGEGMRRIFGENIWINYLKKEYYSSDLGYVLIPDVRKLIEFSTFFVEDGLKAIYIKTDKDKALERIKNRDGYADKKSIEDTNIEKQMSFIEKLPTKTISKSGLKVTCNSGVFSDIYVIDNTRGLDNLKKQVEEWEVRNWLNKDK